MSKLVIQGKNELSGKIRISGAKNSAVALIPACVLTKGKSIIYNVPKIKDIEYLVKILESLNCTVQIKGTTYEIDTTNFINKPIDEELSKEMRASYYFMGALLGKVGEADVSFPGGCKIGNRPIDLHIKGFESLNANVTQNKNRYHITADELIGSKIYLDFPSVGATINIMLAAVKAKGTTVIDNASKEPEIVNLASMLINMGAKLSGAGTSTITVKGVKDLKPAVTEVCPDRIEAGTYLIIGALLGNNLIIENIIVEHINTLLVKLSDVGVKYKIDGSSITINRVNKLKPTNVKTLPYPGFPTDLQQPFSALLTQAEGNSIVRETIYDSRFRNVEYFDLMGADTKITGNTLEIHGRTPLSGKTVFATDLRAGASLVVAGLIAEGTTVIDNVELILRGYEDIVEKLTEVGADISFVE